MQAKQVVKRVYELAQPICTQTGVQLWDVEFEKEGGQHMLTVSIDADGGVDIDQCEAVSRALDPLLDAKEFDTLPAYTLCVSSAGLERRLKKPEHFEQCMGAMVEIKFYKPMDGTKVIEGELAEYDAGFVTLTVDGEARTYAPQDIAAVRLVVQF